MADLSFDDLVPGGGVTFDDLIPAKPKDVEPQGAEPSIWQQLFDVKNPQTGKSYLYGNTPPPAPYEDLQRTVGDTASRGYLDKLRGPEEQARTAAARERMPDWVETPMDVATAVATSPYRVGSTLAGAGIGAAEGAASAYGHQEDWVPDLQGAVDIAKGAGLGAVAGGGGAKLGEVGNDIYSKLAKTRVPNPTAGDPNLLGKVGGAAAPLSLYGNKSWRNFPAITATEWGLTHLGIPPGVTTGVATGLNWLGKTGLARQGAEIANPATTDAARDALAKMLIGMSK